MQKETKHMGKKITFIGFCFSAFFFLVLTAGCVSTSNVATSYYPNTIQTSPVTKLVKVIIPETEKIVMIDGQKVQSATTMYVLPGNHTYTFKVKYRSSTYCNGPFYGDKADPKKDFKLKDGEVSSVVGMDGNYEIDASANEGQTVQFTVKAKPDCKSKINEYFKIEVIN
jgi:ABC-type Fe3+-hydroxamate transport system substrate-binding protein